MLIWRNIRVAAGLLARDERARWVMLVPLSLLTALLEAATTATILALAAMIADPSDPRVLAAFDRWSDFAPASVRDPRMLLPWFLGFAAVLFLIKAATTFATILYNNKIVAKDQSRFAASLFRGYLHLPYVLHLDRHSAEYAHRVRQSVETIFGLILWHALSIIRNSMAIAGLVLVLLLARPFLTVLLGVLVGSWLFLLAFAFRTYHQRAGRQVDEWSLRRERILHEGLGALPEIQMLGRESFFADRFESCEHALIATRYKDATAAAVPRLLNELVFILAMMAVIGLVAVETGDTASLLPLLGLYAYAGLRLLPASNSIVDSMNQINGASHPLEQLLRDRELMSRNAIESTASDGARLELRRAVELQRVSYQYPGAAALVLEDVSLTIEQGSCVAIIGRTGAGKTTLMNVLAGVLTPSAGELRIDGEPLGTRARLWQKRIGYVPQVPFLISDSVRRNIAFGLEDAAVDQARLAMAIRLAGLGDVIRSLPQGVDSSIGQEGRRLSGGQRQRVAIARALYVDPQVLLFDEAMSALDSEAEEEVIEVIRRLRGVKTVVLISHRIQFARHADAVIVLEQGRVQASGTWQELQASRERSRRLADAG